MSLVQSSVHLQAVCKSGGLQMNQAELRGLMVDTWQMSEKLCAYTAMEKFHLIPLLIVPPQATKAKTSLQSKEGDEFARCYAALHRESETLLPTLML